MTDAERERRARRALVRERASVGDVRAWSDHATAASKARRGEAPTAQDREAGVRTVAVALLVALVLLALAVVAWH